MAWVALFLLLFVSGCAAHSGGAVQVHEPFGRDVTLIYIPGISGYGDDDGACIDALRAGGFAGKAQVWDWTGELFPISALWAHARQRAEARRIADRICELRTQSPAAPLVLVGHSAGAGVAVMALEDLPPAVRVDEIVLLAPAISRQYDLTRALRHIRGGADVFYSNRDTIVLALGTSLFGTVDGVHGEAAGHGGFIRPPHAAPDAYAKLHEHPYSRHRQQLGDDGGHQGVLAPGVAATEVAPLLPAYRDSLDPLAVTAAR